MKNIKLIIFDMDGTMFDSESVGMKCQIEAFKQYNCILEPERLHSLFGGSNERNTAILQSWFPDAPVKEIRKQYVDMKYHYIEEHGVGVKKGLVNLLRYCKEHHIFTAVASSSKKEMVELCLNVTDTKQYIDYIVDVASIKNSKPAPDIFNAALTYFHVDASDALVLEDSFNGIEASHNAHIQPIFIPDQFMMDFDHFHNVFVMHDMDQVIRYIDGYTYKRVIFDMDGILFDTEKLCMDVMQEVMKQYGYFDIHEYYYRTIGVNRNDGERIFKETFPDVDHDEMNRQVRSRMEEYLNTNGMNVKPGVYEILEYFKSKGVSLVVASSSSRHSILHHLDLADMTKYFDDIISGDDVKHSKPNPEIFIKAKGYYDIQDCVIFEDSKNGILAGKASGMDTICIPDMLMHNEDILGNTIVFVDILNSQFFDYK